MNARTFSGRRWPTAAEQLVIEAATATPQRAASAWQELNRTRSLDDLRGDSTRLLAQVYRTLARGGSEVPEIARLRGVYRRTWYENQVLTANAVEVMRRLREADIPVLALKGLPVLMHWQRDLGLRHLGDVDLLVRPKHAPAAVATLRALGYQPDVAVREPLPQSFAMLHAVGFARGPGSAIDLHAHALEECCYAGADRGLWERALPFPVNGVEVVRPCAADLLLLVCVHGVRGAPARVVHWVADALAILRGDEPVAWPVLVAEARARRVTLALGHALAFLAARYAAPVPPAVVEALLRSGRGPVERIDYVVEGRAPGAGWMAARDVMRFLRLSRDWSTHRRLTGFPLYLETLWGKERWFALPPEAMRRARARGAGVRAAE